MTSCACYAVYFLNLRGDVLISRIYRDELPPDAVNIFRTSVLNSRRQVSTAPPVSIVRDTTFMHTRINDVYIMCATKTNSNAMLSFRFMRGLCDVLRSYFGDSFCQRHVEAGFLLIYELMDEMSDFGYPQVVDPSVLKGYILQKNVLADLLSSKRKEAEQQDKANHARMQVTGAVGWRRDGIKYKNNEIYLDIIESVNLVTSSKGQVLRADVNGRIVVKCFMSGMPEVKIGLNDKASDVTFHPCVNLSKFNVDRVVSCVPPDGEFELMRYRATEGISLPFKVIPVITERGRNRLEVMIKVKSVFNPKLWAINVAIHIPVPKDTARTTMEASIGKVKYDLSKQCLVWKIKRFVGEQEHNLSADVELMGVLGERERWKRPPVQMRFDVPMFAASGLLVQYLRAWEKTGYEVQQWVRKVTSSGEYTIRT
ncbi:unnamed protein product [Pedinophyceae sp. YPF-701]|nr:unnamed protein product [Pedinophyceae sp. YPF-701]